MPPQFGEQLLQIGQRNLLPPSDIGECHLRTDQQLRFLTVMGDERDLLDGGEGVGHRLHRLLHQFHVGGAAEEGRRLLEAAPPGGRVAPLPEGPGPLDARTDRKEFAKASQGLGFCNITKCCTEVCPEHIKITDNALIPMKERVVDRKYDPVVWLGSKIFRRK